MRFHVNQSQRLLEENNEHATRNSILIEAILMHIGLLCKHERCVLETYKQFIVNTICLLV